MSLVLGRSSVVQVGAVALFFTHGGCEIVAIPTFIFGNRYAVYCPVNVVDVVERDLRTKAR